VWAAHLRGSGFVNVIVEEGAVLASCYGEMFCLDPLTGNGKWQNPFALLSEGHYEATQHSLTRAG